MVLDRQSLPCSRITLTSKNDTLLVCSVFIVNDMLAWQEFKQFWNRFKWSNDLKSTNLSSTYRRWNDGLYSKGIYVTNFVQGKPKMH